MVKWKHHQHGLFNLTLFNDPYLNKFPIMCSQSEKESKKHLRLWIIVETVIVMFQESLIRKTLKYLYSFRENTDPLSFYLP